MTDGIGLYDLLLGAALVGATWRALFGREPFGATVFFIAYGLLLSLMWVQLGAPDVALAEASIGAGLTGALLLGGIRQFERDDLLHAARGINRQNIFAGLLSFSLAATIILVLWDIRFFTDGISNLVRENQDTSGSSHPVTSVLLNFRGFDTWLELCVLLLAALAASIVRIANRNKLPKLSVQIPNKQITMIARTLLPILILIAGIMLWFGARAPGGAFQAGALLGAAGILLQLASQNVIPERSSWAFRVVLALGVATFTIVATSTILMGRNLLDFPPDWAGTLIFLIEVAATMSIALTLNVVYASNAPTGNVKAPQ